MVHDQVREIADSMRGWKVAIVGFDGGLDAPDPRSLEYDTHLLLVAEDDEVRSEAFERTAELSFLLSDWT
jgi:hypothetical protein